MEAALKNLLWKYKRLKKKTHNRTGNKKANNTTSLGNSTSEKEALAKLEMILKMS